MGGRHRKHFWLLTEVNRDHPPTCRPLDRMLGSPLTCRCSLPPDCRTRAAQARHARMRGTVRDEPDVGRRSSGEETKKGITMIRIQNNGLGVQSTTIFLMAH